MRKLGDAGALAALAALGLLLGILAGWAACWGMLVGVVLGLIVWSGRQIIEFFAIRAAQVRGRGDGQRHHRRDPPPTPAPQDRAVSTILQGDSIWRSLSFASVQL